jgi:hypothetical protein
MSETTMSRWERDPIPADPDLRGVYGRAWQCDLRAAAMASGIDPEADCSGAAWLIEAPAAHPVWHSYWLHCVYLRPNTVRGALPTKWYLEGATHELWLWALDPDQPRAPMLQRGAVKYLTPSNFAAQFIAADDATAAQRIRDAVTDICQGRLSPDTDYRRMWADRFGDNMLLDRP